ncbi:helix-turn-helix domain-containing protein [Halomonas sp. EGI 63088]|uniref:Helix-turn-helix domain-containing protein n=1 Tax=Halomonas flagellata TaxID=2920385 RepID=A0ABS9RV01_9GAMM|nr:helix-turn-helix domain-containing protein [Halomonas flagellata]MCH4563650.1 helix-turn-helix domain-containing protein [Halomonas flagellata]
MGNDMMRAEIWLQETLESQLGIEDLAKRLGYSSSQVRRRFRQRFGIGPGAYRDLLRLEKAARLLVHTPHGVRQIAELCGYRNHSAFSRAFQRRYERSPRDFRRAQRLQLRRSDPATGREFAVELRLTPAQEAIVTRLYAPSMAIDTPAAWQQHLEVDDALPDRLSEATPIALLHDQPLASDMPRTDLGVQVAHGATIDVALPLPFRLIELPARRCACLTFGEMAQLPTAVRFLVGRSLPEKGVHFNGEAPRLLHTTAGLELQLPLLEPASAS